MSDENEKAITLQEQLANLQKQNLIEGQVEIDEVLKRRGLTLVGVPQYVQRDGAWLTVIQVGLAPLNER